ncbi:GAP family protein [Rhodococcus sp. NPDC056743]|uniref:GAP family protein n=1 Tax=Rhodococcus sp. NPDC056743 TaxID=3345934 RepID=UPI00366BFE31
MQPLLLSALAGLAFLDSLDVLLVGITTAVIYDSRLKRRSPLPGGLSFLGGVFAATTAFGICTVIGINFIAELVDFELTPAVRYWGGMVLGLVLIALACMPATTSTTSTRWAEPIRRRPWILGFIGLAIGLVQAPTAIPYLAALAMLSAHDPPLTAWPLIVVIYCVLALLPPLLILGLSLRRTVRARRAYRRIVRVLARYGPASVRVLFVTIGLILVVDALIHYNDLW